jgi:hypothetical protein
VQTHFQFCVFLGSRTKITPLWQRVDSFTDFWHINVFTPSTIIRAVIAIYIYEYCTRRYCFRQHAHRWTKFIQKYIYACARAQAWLFGFVIRNTCSCSLCCFVRAECGRERTRRRTYFSEAGGRALSACIFFILGIMQPAISKSEFFPLPQHRHAASTHLHTWMQRQRASALLSGALRVESERRGMCIRIFVWREAKRESVKFYTHARCQSPLKNFAIRVGGAARLLQHSLVVCLRSGFPLVYKKFVTHAHIIPCRYQRK